MLSTIYLIALFGLSPTEASFQGPVNPTGILAAVVDDQRDEYERRLELAKGDVKKLWMLHNYCLTNGMTREDRSVLRAILRLDSEHLGAHKALGHLFYDDQWFSTEKKLKAYKAKREIEVAEAKGWVRYKGEWMDPADVEKLKAGLVQDENGVWLTPEIMKYRAEGWIQFDLEWIPPAEQQNIDNDLFKCGGEWLSESDANQYHSTVDRFWTIPSEDGQFILYTTLDREQALEALDLAEGSVSDLVRLFGRAPKDPVVFVVVRNLKQYGRFASGDRQAKRLETERRGLSSLYGAYFADSWLDSKLNHMGAGVAYWDSSTESGDVFGKLFLRNAAGLAFVEGLDQSPKTIKKLKTTRNFDIQAFFGEKRLPPWIRRGAAAYVDRYHLVNEVDTDPLSLRRWAMSNITKRGGLDKVSKILEMKLAVEFPAESEKLISEAGILVAFILDGDHADVKEKHAAFVDAFAKGVAFEDQLKALEASLVSAAAEIKKFAEL